MRKKPAFPGAAIAVLAILAISACTNPLGGENEFTPPPSYGISLDKTSYTFSPRKTGQQPESLTVTVTNKLSQATGALTITLSGANPGSFDLSAASITGIAAGEADTFVVEPKSALGAGTYNAVVTVSGEGGIKAALQVSFTVTDTSIYGISLDKSSHSFPGALTGYTPSSLQVIITNTGNEPTGTLAIVSSNISFACTPTSTSAAVGATTSFTVAPVSSLGAGTHNATITVSGENGIYKTLQVSFTVMINFNTLDANGNAATTTTSELILAFNEDITDLSADDIDLNANGTGAVKGDLTSTGSGNYTLGLSGITKDGTVWVSVSKEGYNITGGPKSADVYVAPAFVSLGAKDAHQGAGKTTDTLILTFNKDIPGLTASDLVFDAGTTGAAAGTLTGKGEGVYELPVSGITSGGTVGVTINKSGTSIDEAHKDAEVYLALAFAGLSADGSAIADTTKLTLTFNQDIEGLMIGGSTVSALSAGNITLTGTGVVKGALSESGSVYELTVSGITSSGPVTVNVNLSGHLFNGTVNVTKASAGPLPEGNISLELWVDEDDTLTSTVYAGAASGGGTYTIDRSEGESIIVTLASGVSLTRWNVPGSTIGGTSAPIKVEARQFLPGDNYRITVFVTKSGMLYSTDIPFTVTE
jgi:hypothetical protein